MEFVGKSLALSASGLAAVATQLSTGSAEVSAVISVETSGMGFLPARRPQILFERHVFARLTGGKYNKSNPDISNVIPGGYGDPGANQYTRLGQAIALDRESALKSASWGLGQVMGENYQMGGYPDVETMVAAMADSEDAQLSMMAGFILSAKLESYLWTHNWPAFARGYNGPDYAAHRYDVELNGFYQKYMANAMPDLVVRAAQMYLEFRGFDPHGVDGVPGVGTLSAVKAFQASVGMAATGTLDDATMQALLPQ